jgi:hypothetical protein
LISKSDCNQLTGSHSWFATTYDATCKAVPILIHPSNRFDRYSSPLETTRIIDKEHLELLKKNIRAYTSVLTSTDPIGADFLTAQLEYFGLTAAKFTSTYTVKFTKD